MTTDRITVAIDAMGGDHAPDQIVAGALATAAELDVAVRLYGRAEDVLARIPGGTVPDHVEVVDCREVIAMDDEPAAAVRRMKDASVVRAAQAVRDGEADAMISAGNTGAAMAAALLRMGRIPGIARPAIAVPIPVPGSHPQVLIDAGATVDATPEWLVQFARMGRVYARVRWGIEEPTAGLLSNGEEEGKGDTLRKTVYELLRKEPGFIGNVEGSDLMRPGRADVFVTDGFTGNIALKTIEGTAKLYTGFLRETFRTSIMASIGYLLARPAINSLRTRVDPRRYNGAIFLGLNGIAVKSHGGTDAVGFANAIGVAIDMVVHGAIEKIKEDFARLTTPPLPDVKAASL
jgi:glycerol-3-phosphate acyltransferase PlsX